MTYPTTTLQTRIFLLLTRRGNYALCNDDDKKEVVRMKKLNEEIVFSELLCNPSRNIDFLNLVKSMRKENLWDCMELESVKDALDNCMTKRLEETQNISTFQDYFHVYPTTILQTRTLLLLTRRGSYALYALTWIATRFWKTMMKLTPVKGMRKEKLWDCLELESVKAVLDDCITNRFKETENIATFQDYYHLLGCIAPGLRVCASGDTVKEAKLIK
ncbi:unnamed protein product, partial [Allacma fusca]